MRSEKEQMAVGKDKSVVEIQFRDIPGEQESASGNIKQKEEKKEVFTKVGVEGDRPWRCTSSAPRTATRSEATVAIGIMHGWDGWDEHPA